MSANTECCVVESKRSALMDRSTWHRSWLCSLQIHLLKHSLKTPARLLAQSQLSERECRLCGNWVIDRASQGKMNSRQSWNGTVSKCRLSVRDVAALLHDEWMVKDHYYLCVSVCEHLKYRCRSGRAKHSSRQAILAVECHRGHNGRISSGQMACKHHLSFFFFPLFSVAP